MADFNVGDLQFILQQIKISEALANHTLLDGTPFTGTKAELTAILIPNPLLPWGLRTVDGSDNNISLPGVRDEWGASDQLFPRLLEQELNGASNGTSYTQVSGSVVDPQIRLASNAVVDQTLNNPAAIYAALFHEGITGADADAAVAEIQAAYQASLLPPGQPDPQAIADAQAALNAALVNQTLANTVLGAANATSAAYASAATFSETVKSQVALVKAYLDALATDTDGGGPLPFSISDSLTGNVTLIVNGSPVVTTIRAAVQTAFNSAIAAQSAANNLVNALQPNGIDLVSLADITAAQGLQTLANALATAMTNLYSGNPLNGFDETNGVDTGNNVTGTDFTRFGQARSAADSINAAATANDAAEVDSRIDAAAASAVLQSQAANANVTSADAAVLAAQQALADALAGITGTPTLGDILTKYNLSTIGHGTATTQDDSLVIDNIAPDEGISAPFNGWMTLFGQFFDHGLDLVTKGGNGTVFVPLASDDPLYDFGADGIVSADDGLGADGVIGTTDDSPNFMTLTRATQVVRQAGADGQLNTADDTFRARTAADTTFETINTTTPFVDQNQTYTSHPSHQVFLREYVDANPGAGVNIQSTGRFLNGTAGGLATWADVKAQSASMLGIRLVDADIGNIPLLATDAFGEFIRGPNGFAQVVIRTGNGPDNTPGTADDVHVLVEGNPAANGNTGLTLAQLAASTGIPGATAVRTGHAFLDDIAHTANPFGAAGVNGMRQADANTTIGDHLVQLDVNGDSMANRGPSATGGSSFYDNELLDAHFITGDGRGNENIGLTAVHDVFHSEHNRLAEQTKTVVLATRDRAFINEWLSTDLAANINLATVDLTTLLNNLDSANAWDGERLFQAARFGTEMQYQHMVFEEFARKVNPMVDLFIFNPTEDINPAIFAEFAHVVYRFGHSMLTETIDRYASNVQVGDDKSMALFDAFLNPLAFNNSNPLQFINNNTAVDNNIQDLTAEEASAYIIRGMTAQTGQAIDEFVVEALRNNLVGLPLDLPTLNMARARDTGVPGLNDTRTQLFEMTKSEWLKPYVSWTDFAQSLKNPASIINFIAAYGTHSSITSVATLEEKRLAAMELVLNVDLNGGGIAADRDDFLNGSGAYGKAAGLGGLDKVDLWLGGLAEAILPFGGMLGSTFTAIFEKQMQNLQNGDRFYYLSRTQGLHFITELENNSFAAIIKNNTTIGDTIATDQSTVAQGGSGHIPGEAFARVEQVLEVNLNFQREPDPEEEDQFLGGLQKKVLRLNDNAVVGVDDINPSTQPDAIKVIHSTNAAVNALLDANNTYDNLLHFRGGEHVVLGGTDERDVLIADLGDDTIWGDGGNDLIIGDHGINRLHGGDGDDIIYGGGDAEFIHGEAGNDVIHAGNGLGDLVFGGGGHDFIISGEDGTEVFAAEGNDFILGTADVDFLLGGEGDDWIEGGEGFDTIAGENSELFFNSSIIGHDVAFAGSNEQDFDMESGDDIMVGGESVMRYEGMFGFDWVSFKGVETPVNADMRTGLLATTVEADILRNRFDRVEAVSGWRNNDILTGDERTNGEAGALAETVFATDELNKDGLARISGLRDLFTVTGNNPVFLNANADTNTELNNLAGSAVVFDRGNIVLGGDGSDVLQGLAGDDVIHGDKWLNVRIGINNDAGEQIGTADMMQGTVNFYTTNAERDAAAAAEAARGGTTQFARADDDNNANNANAYDALEGQQLDTLVFSRLINPGQLQIVREILTDTTNNDRADTTTAPPSGAYNGDVDTAVFRGNLAEYTVRAGGPTGTIILGGGATPTSITAAERTLIANAGDRITVEHTAAITAGAALNDGTDLLAGIERLQFGDTTINVYDGLNSSPVGSPQIRTLVDPDGNPIVQAGLPLLIRTNADGSLFGVSDADNNAPITSFTVIWQVEETPGAGDFVDTGVTGLTFIPDALAGFDGERVRAAITYTDGKGLVERVVSTPTTGMDPATGVTQVAEVTLRVGTHAVPAPANLAFHDAVVAARGLTGQTAAQIAAQLGYTLGQPGTDGPGGDVAGGAGEDEIHGLSGNDVLDGGAGDDILNGGGGIDTARFTEAIGNYVLQINAEGDLEVISTVGNTEDAVLNIENLLFTNNTNGLGDDVTLSHADVMATLAALAADPATDPGELSVAATNGDNVLAGTAAADTINALGGNDLVFGLGGNDILNGGAGDDELRGGLGNDTILGDAGNDLIVWNAGDGRDLVNGDTGNGNSGVDVDTFEIVGAAVAETFRVISLLNPPTPAVAAEITALRNAQIAAGTPIAATTEIVVLRNGAVIAELRNIEELVINSIVTPAGGGNLGGDTVQVIGDFTNTSLALATITINGTEGDDTVDITMLSSAHRIVFRSKGGDDTIVGTIREQDVIELAPGMTPDDYDPPLYNGNGTWTITQKGGGHSITYTGGPGMAAPTFAAGSTDGEGTPRNTAFALTQADLDGLKALVSGTPSDEDEAPVGVRILSGIGQGVPDDTFIRLTDAHFGANGAINPLFEGLDPRDISDILGTQEVGLAKNAAGSNIFFMAFGQYFDHGLDFITKGGNGKILIDGQDAFDPQTGQPQNFVDLNRATQIGTDLDGNPVYQNQTSPFVDQNQAYGSHELVGQFLRESDGAGGFGSHLLAGAADPNAAGFKLLPTLRELIKHHVDAGSKFGPEAKTLLEVYPGLMNGDGTVNATVAAQLASNFMGSGHNLLLDANRGVSVLDHYIAGDGRTNENITLTSMHTVWARNHNFHVENLETAGFDGTPEELFQAAKMLNEAEYQRVVFTEYADALLGGLRGVGDHGFKEHNPDADPRISHEFAAAVFRVGHSLIADTLTVKGVNGQMQDVLLKDAFLNPGQYKTLGAGNILGGIATQQAEEVDFNLVNAVRNDLVGTKADLFAFNVARGWDVGLGTLNQVRKGLAASSDPYVSEARSYAGNLSPYTSWDDFQQRNNLSDALINQFKQAYPDLVLDTQAKIDAFELANPDIELVNGNTVKGIDRVELWVGGLAEKHINGGQVGQTFWVVLHEQFDRLQEADRFYYTERFDGFDFYAHELEDMTFADIVARNTGLTGLPDDIFHVGAATDGGTGSGDGDGDGAGSGDDDGAGDDDNGSGSGDDDSDNGEDDSDSDSDGTTPPGPITSAHVVFAGTGGNDTSFGSAGNDTMSGAGGNDTLFGYGGDDSLVGGDGNDEIFADAGKDVISGGDGADRIFAGDGDDIVLAGTGNDTVDGGAGNDKIWGDAGRDVINGGLGNDVIFASAGDGNDAYHGDEGIDTVNFEAITSNLTIDLVNLKATSVESGEDTLSGIENVIGGAGNDTIVADGSVNVLNGGGGLDTFVFNTASAANGDRIEGFQAGDKIDLSGVFGAAGTPATLHTGNFNAAGQLKVSIVDGNSVIEGNIDTEADAEFSITVVGHIVNKSDIL